MDYSHTDHTLQEQLASLLLPFRTGNIKYPNVLDQVAVITHGTGGLLLANAIANGYLVPHHTMRWFSLNTPLKGPSVEEYLENNCPNKKFKKIFNRLAKIEAGSKQLFKCQDNDKAQTVTAPMNLDFYITKAACGVVASHNSKRQESFLDMTTDPKDRNSFMKTLSDGITKAENCFRVGEKGQINYRYAALGTNYWESQMQVADPITGGVQRWLHERKKDFEVMVNSASPQVDNYF